MLVCKYTYIYTQIYVHIFKYIHLCVYICINMCIYRYIFKYTYTYIYIYLHSAILVVFIFLYCIKYTFICPALTVLHMVIYMFQCYSFSPSLPFLPSLCPQVCSLYLHIVFYNCSLSNIQKCISCNAFILKFLYKLLDFIFIQLRAYFKNIEVLLS